MVQLIVKKTVEKSTHRQEFTTSVGEENTKSFYEGAQISYSLLHLKSTKHPLKKKFCVITHAKCASKFTCSAMPGNSIPSWARFLFTLVFCKRDEFTLWKLSEMFHTSNGMTWNVILTNQYRRVNTIRKPLSRGVFKKGIKQFMCTDSLGTLLSSTSL